MRTNTVPAFRGQLPQGTAALRLAGSAAVLGLCLWALVAAPEPWLQPPAAPQGASAETEARDLQDQAASLVRAGRAAEALPLLQRVHEQFPDNHIVIGQMADIQDQLGHFQEETSLLEEYLKRSPTPWSANPQLGEAYWKLGQVDAALNAFERFRAMDAKDPDALFFLAHAYERARRYAQARSCYRTGVAAFPDEPDLKNGLARMELFVGSSATSLKLAREVVARRPNNVEGLMVLGMAERSLGEYPQAKRDLGHALELSPDNVDVLRVLAGIAEHQNQTEVARRDYQRVLSMEPGDAQAQSRLDRLDQVRRRR
jgi:tetratricopeptide (TPR) repeat protein